MYAMVSLSFQTCRTMLWILFSSGVTSPQIVKRKSGHGESIGIALNMIASDDQTWWLIRILYLVSVRWDTIKVMGICFGLVTWLFGTGGATAVIGDLVISAMAVSSLYPMLL